MVKRQFNIDNGLEQIPVEGHEPRKVAIKYLMKRRRSLLMTKDPDKVERLYAELPQTIRVIGKKATKCYKINWERVSSGEFEGARFTFTLEERE